MPLYHISSWFTIVWFYHDVWFWHVFAEFWHRLHWLKTPGLMPSNRSTRQFLSVKLKNSQPTSWTAHLREEQLRKIGSFWRMVFKILQVRMCQPRPSEVQAMHRGLLKRIKSYAERRNAITSRLRRKAVTTGTNTWKSKVERTLRQAERNHVADIANSDDPKLVWKYIKSKRKDNVGISTLKVDVLQFLMIIAKQKLWLSNLTVFLTETQDSTNHTTKSFSNHARCCSWSGRSLETFKGHQR